jgi:hypothetical protein
MKKQLYKESEQRENLHAVAFELQCEKDFRQQYFR